MTDIINPFFEEYELGEKYTEVLRPFYCTFKSNLRYRQPEHNLASVTFMSINHQFFTVGSDIKFFKEFIKLTDWTEVTFWIGGVVTDNSKFNIVISR